MSHAWFVSTVPFLWPVLPILSKDGIHVDTSVCDWKSHRDDAVLTLCKDGSYEITQLLLKTFGGQ